MEICSIYYKKQTNIALFDLKVSFTFIILQIAMQEIIFLDNVIALCPIVSIWHFKQGWICCCCFMSLLALKQAGGLYNIFNISKYYLHIHKYTYIWIFMNP